MKATMNDDPPLKPIERILAGNSRIERLRIDMEKHDLEIGFTTAVPGSA